MLNGRRIMTSSDDGNGEGTTRRKVLECMTWAGTGLLWTVAGGVPRSLGLVDQAMAAEAPGLTFVQISDSHMGFDKPANPNAKGTLEEADRPDQRAAAETVVHDPHRRHHASVEGCRIRRRREDHFGAPSSTCITSPASTTSSTRRRSSIASATAADAKGDGWYSFDAGGVHFVGLVNVKNLKAGGMGSLGEDQLKWLADDLQAEKRFHAGRRVRSRPAVGRVREVGLGHRGWRPRAGDAQAIWIGDGAQWSHPSGDAESRRQGRVSHRAFDGVSAAGAREPRRRPVR